MKILIIIVDQNIMTLNKKYNLKIISKFHHRIHSLMQLKMMVYKMNYKNEQLKYQGLINHNHSSKFRVHQIQ